MYLICSVGQHRVLWSYVIFVYFWTDIFANLSLELVYSQLEEFGQGGGGADAVVIKRSAWKVGILRVRAPLCIQVSEKQSFFSRSLVAITRIVYCVEPQSLHDWEVTCSASDRQGSNFESYVWRAAVWSYSSHHSQGDLTFQIRH